MIALYILGLISISLLGILLYMIHHQQREQHHIINTMAALADKAAAATAASMTSVRERPRPSGTMAPHSVGGSGDLGTKFDNMIAQGEMPAGDDFEIERVA